MNPNLIRLITVYFTIIPIIAGILAFKKSQNLFRFFLVFLVYGFITDIFTHHFKAEYPGLTKNIFIFYSLVECSFFLYFLKQATLSRFVKKLNSILIAFYFILWLLIHFLPVSMNMQLKSANSFFIALYEMPVSFISGYVLLNLIESGDRPSNYPAFWFSSGIFLYCFTTFFITSLMHTELLNRIWFVHNIINMATYISYTYGFFRIATNNTNRFLPNISSSLKTN